MSTQTVPTRGRKGSQGLDARKQVARRRVAAQMIVDARKHAALRRVAAPMIVDAHEQAALRRVAAPMIVDAHEQAALRRLTAQMIAEAVELPPTTWVAGACTSKSMDPDAASAPRASLAHGPLTAGKTRPQSWVRVRSDRCPLTLEEEACLSRVAALLRAEAVELGPESSVGARLDSRGIRLALECENPNRPGARVRRSPRATRGGAAARPAR